MVAGAGTATLTVPLSNTVPGAAFYNQGGVLDPGANPAGLVLSAGAVGQIGGK